MPSENIQMLFSFRTTQHLHLDFHIDLDFVVNMFRQKMPRYSRGKVSRNASSIALGASLGVPVDKFAKSLVAFFFCSLCR